MAMSQVRTLNALSAVLLGGDRTTRVLAVGEFI
jgi:hypothetical protein